MTDIKNKNSLEVERTISDSDCQNTHLAGKSGIYDCMKDAGNCSNNIENDVRGSKKTDLSSSSLNLPNDEFYFESEHVALRGNKDYLNLLKTIAVLEAQRRRAIKDIDILVSVKEIALKEPVKFVQKLQNGENLGLPSPQIIAEVPEINWSQYGMTTPNESMKPVTRKNRPESRNIWKTEDTEDKSKILVRGRAFDDSKPETFNQLWTTEEQLRLEELLLQYPPEENESRRWKKIAAALGNRTPKQVCSRVQKYFIKLTKAGLPVPGRQPRKLYESSSKRGIHRHQKNNHMLYKPSTFFPSQSLPVYMNDFDDESVSHLQTYPSQDSAIKLEPEDDLSEDDRLSISEDMENSEDYEKFLLLSRVKRDKEKHASDEFEIEHDGFKCDFCQEEPIIGTRWHCGTCPSTKSADFCTDCVITQLESDNPHPLSHKLLPIRSKEICKRNVWDQDYALPSFSLSSNSSSYNYLDPNFMPQ